MLNQPILRIDIASWVTAAHVIAVTLGLGGALAADALVLTRALFRPITSFVVEALEALSRFVMWGLAAVWLTGALLAWIKFGGTGHVSQKFLAKLAIVGLLTANSGLVHGVVLPAVAKRVGSRLFSDATLRRCAGFAFIGAASSVSWIAPVLLGVARELGVRATYEEVMGVYALAVIAAAASITLLTYGSVLALRARARFPAEPVRIVQPPQPATRTRRWIPLRAISARRQAA